MRRGWLVLITSFLLSVTLVLLALTGCRGSAPVTHALRLEFLPLYQELSPRLLPCGRDPFKITPDQPCKAWI